jgi:DNA-binding NtrC family response regulator
MAKSLRILVVDDNRSAANALARVLRKGGDEVEPLYDGRQAIDRIEMDPPDVVLTDLKMSPVGGMEVLKAARAQRPPVECLVFTAFGDVDIAVEAMRLGARDFLTKPVTVEQVNNRMDQLREHGSSGVIEASGNDQPFVAVSPAGRRLYDLLQRAADTTSRLWIEGNIGSGRAFAAETLQTMSQVDSSLVILDLGRDVRWPESGTVLLPNVDDLPDDLQRRLFRSLQHVPRELRVIATAGPNGRRRVAEGVLRAELYYTLAVLVIEVPPLSERAEDILPLFDQALDRFADRYGRTRPDPSPQTRDAVQRHAWPGNVRELLNLAERMVVMSTDSADFMMVENRADGLPNLEQGFNLAQHLEGVERRILVQALAQCDGDRAAAGRLLGVERNTLRYKLNKHGLLGH